MADALPPWNWLMIRAGRGNSGIRPLEKLLRRGATALLLLLGGYLLLWPVPIEPHRWKPRPDPGRTGPYVANDDLARAELQPVGTRAEDVAPETAALGPDGRIYTGLANG